MTPLPTRPLFTTILVGMLLSQAAWALALPAFRGIDEVDHAYKAASVVHGDLVAKHQSHHGRGGLVTVPRTVVLAASGACKTYGGMGHDNCHPAQATRDPRLVLAASGASQYNPVYYAVVGPLASLFGGTAFDYALRMETALLCALLVAWGGVLVSRWARSRWTLPAYLLGITPMLVFSTIIASPNGLTYASAALLWAALLKIVDDCEVSRADAIAVAVAGVIMVVTHTTGAMWLALIAVSCLPLLRTRQWRDIVTEQWLRVGGAVLAIVGATAGVGAWARYANTNALGPSTHPDPLTAIDWINFHALWLIQGIGVFPARNDRAPTILYVAWGGVLLLLICLFLRFATHRQRVSAGLLVLSILIVPTVLTIVSYDTGEMAWQGRYSLPLWLGITTLAARALARREGPSIGVVAGVAALLAIAAAWCSVSLARDEPHVSGLVPLAGHIPGGLVLVAALSALGTALPFLLSLRLPAAPLDRQASA